MNKVLIWIWHAIFYVFAPPPLRRYALTCREAVTELNASDIRSRRLRLHLSLCQGCTNYLKYTLWLRTNFPRKKLGHIEDLTRKIFERL